MDGLKIRLADGSEFFVAGAVTYKPEYDCYYCAAQSWPAEIVAEVYGNVRQAV